MHLVRSCRLLALAIPLAACARRGDDARARESPANGVVPPISADAPTQSGDIRIDNEEGGVDLALLNDTISGGLSQSALAKARRETDSASVKGTGFGASIEKMVKGSVQSAIGTRVGFPLTDIRGARYENGTIIFDWVGTPRISFDNVNVNDRKLLEFFRPSDAERFVAAVNARIRTREQR